MITDNVDLPGLDISLHLDIEWGRDTHALFDELNRHIPWEQRSVVVFNKRIVQPRLISWHGDFPYTYSGLRLDPKSWTSTLLDLRDRISGLTGSRFNGVLLNLYRDGQDSIGMHNDNEFEFGYCPIIASLSLGESRTMKFRHKYMPDHSFDLVLEHGSLLVMKGNTQKYWNHGIAKTTRRIGPRINLTFRDIVNPRW